MNTFYNAKPYCTAQFCGNTKQSKLCVKKSSAEGSAHGCGWWLCSCNPAYFPDVEISILLKYTEQWYNGDDE